MQGEIIAVGNELTSGRIINSTSAFAARHLFAVGYDILAMHTIGDTPELIGVALKRAISRADFVIVTGGLGATDDDLTTEAVATALHRPTIPNLDLLAQIRQHLDSIDAPPMDPLEKLAWLPQGAEALSLGSKMSGYLLIHDQKPIFFLPGIPEQMQILLIEQVIPRLMDWNPEPAVITSQRLYKIFGLEEAFINRQIKALALPAEISIGYYPVFPEVHLSLILRAAAGSRRQPVFAAACTAVEQALTPHIYGHDEDSLASVTGQLLQAAQLTVATAESCTGGLIGHLFTQTPGSSSYFLGGITAYANTMKTAALGVSGELLAEHGAVSAETATVMATGICTLSSADIGIAVTGIAGPDGGTASKPVGTVFIALAVRGHREVHRYQFLGSRQQIQTITAKTALDLTRKYLLQSKTE